MRTHDRTFHELLSFEHGIDGNTVRTRGEELSVQPSQREMPPPEVGMRSHLDALFKRTNLTGYLIEAFAPSPIDRTILLPTEFRNVMSSTQIVLRTVAQKSRRKSQELRAAMHVLNDAEKLMDYHIEKYRELFLG